MNQDITTAGLPAGPTTLNAILEELRRHARICEVASQDLTEAALTGETSDKEKNTQQAAEWMLKSAVWLEAEAAIRGLTETPAQPQINSAMPLPDAARFAANSPPRG